MPLSRLSWCQRWPYTSVNQQNGKNRAVPRNFSWPVDRPLILVYSVGWTYTPICSYQRTIQMYNCIIIIIIPCYYRVYCIQYYWVQQNNKVIPHRLFLRLPHWNAGFDISSLCHLLWFRPLLSRTMQDPFKCYINISIIGFAPMGIKKGIFFLIWRSYTDSQILQIFIIIGSMYGVYIYMICALYLSTFGSFLWQMWVNCTTVPCILFDWMIPKSGTSNSQSLRVFSGSIGSHGEHRQTTAGPRENDRRTIQPLWCSKVP